MGFYKSQPFDTAEAYLLQAEIYPPLVLVDVKGDAPNFTSEIQLSRNSNVTGGLVVEVMGWTGPLGEGTTPYNVSQSFQTLETESVVVIGENKHQIVPIKTIPKEHVEDFLKQRAASK